MNKCLAASGKTSSLLLVLIHNNLLERVAQASARPLPTATAAGGAFFHVRPRTGRSHRKDRLPKRVTAERGKHSFHNRGETRDPRRKKIPSVTATSPLNWGNVRAVERHFLEPNGSAWQVVFMHQPT